MASCGDVNATLERLSEARQIAADLHLHFTKATDAANRAVMADTDEASLQFAKEAEHTTESVETDMRSLRPLLENLGYKDEIRLLDQFATRFAEYRVLDRRILDLAVQNTNLKAQRLSFGAAQEAADRVRDALEAAVPHDTANEKWHVTALVATAIAAVREIQVLQASHIASADDAAMTGMEKQMAVAEATARASIKTLTSLVDGSARPKLDAATTGLDAFMHANADIMALSRRNTNVYSLALSLDQKRKLVVPCEDFLRALQQALASRGYPKGKA